MANKAKINSNPTMIPWPTDRWGFTRELKKAVTQACSRLAGDPDKKAVLDETLSVALGFIEVSFKESVRERKLALERLYGKQDEAAEVKSAPTVTAPVKEATTEDALFDVED